MAGTSPSSFVSIGGREINLVFQLLTSPRSVTVKYLCSGHMSRGSQGTFFIWEKLQVQHRRPAREVSFM